MSTIVTINSGDQITSSRADINSNFAALNADKEEVSNKSTDSTFASADDTTYPTTLATKQYVDAGGNVNASTTGKGIVEEAIESEVRALSAAGGTGARLFMNPSTAGPVFGIKSVTAGATITGATLPVPVYQNDSDNEFYACDANDTAAMKFLGFAISNGTDGTAMTVQFNGIVSGFTGLTEGEKYYVSDTVGTIANTVGTYEVLVGVAISETELLIQKGRRVMTGTTSFSSTTTTAVVTGFRPSIVRVHAARATTANGGNVHSHGSWTVGGGNRCLRITNDDSSGAVVSTSTSAAWNTNSSVDSDGASGTITNVTDTGFTLSNTNVADTVQIYWEAEGEL